MKQVEITVRRIGNLSASLPVWAAAHWNRQARQVLGEIQGFPIFHDFISFMSVEIACNPIITCYAIYASEQGERLLQG